MPARRTRLIRAWTIDDKRLARASGTCGKTCGKLDLACQILIDRAPMLADREGRMPGDAAWVWRELFSFFQDVCEEEVEQMLDLLHTLQYIQRYEVAGESWIQLLYFAKDQCPDKRERASEIPAPPDFQPGQTGILPFGPFAVNSPEPSANLRRTFGEPSAKLRPWDAMDTGDTGTPPVVPPQNLRKTSRT